MGYIICYIIGAVCMAANTKKITDTGKEVTIEAEPTRVLGVIIIIITFIVNLVYTVYF